MMMSLGSFIFEIRTATYQELQRSTQQRWQSSNRVGRRPAQQYIGPGEENINMPGVIYPELAGTDVSLDIIRAMANAGEPFILIDGQGHLHGRWVITTVEETQNTFMSDGKARKITFTINLKRYGEDGTNIINPAIGITV